MNRSLFKSSLPEFLAMSEEAIHGRLASQAVTVEGDQGPAWLGQTRILKQVLAPWAGESSAKIYLEWSVPRVGKRIDLVLVIRNVVLVVEFKVDADAFLSVDIDQVWDYALDLKNFHETSHDAIVVPVLVATRAPTPPPIQLELTAHEDRLYRPICTNADQLAAVIGAALDAAAIAGAARLDPDEWESGRYRPTPTILEAARALYQGHTVADISRSDASAETLLRTSATIDRIIATSRQESRKSICFVTGVPGAGKTLVGLKVATDHSRTKDLSHSTFLSGNRPLVQVMTEALTRDKVARERASGKRPLKADARRQVSAFIQMVHHFRDEYLKDRHRPPVDRVVIFDEAQRAWNRAQTAAFMRRKRNLPDFHHSEPEFLISCMDRHQDWSVVICLVGGGQEINTGEAGITEWIDALVRGFPDWHIHLSPRLTEPEYGAVAALSTLQTRPGVHMEPDLHLSISMRSFRAETVSDLVKAILDQESETARQLHAGIRDRYPIMLTRDLQRAKRWLRERARGSERYGVLVSSEAQRLKPHAIDVRSPMDPVHWFLGPKEDVRSSYYLEDVATQFHVQGLELDWAAIVWDGDFRVRRGGSPGGWSYHSFVGESWNRTHKADAQMFLKNAYRVLLTRARQGMVVVVPEGTPEDPTRAQEIYDPTFEYLKDLGLTLL